MPKKLEIESLVDSLATISDIIFKRIKCLASTSCEPCGAQFMKALDTLRKASKPVRAPRRAAKKKAK